ncbi:glucagon-1-like isoform X1 [Esox lucius]|uniref:glucagon-1-like isoform X1 n=1 Tax=Esox lucius TaxID=8010 RepID=UPI0009733410|nr:glucagon-1-like isoform X1 [Esox lucius]XP_019907132.1 glucagon-1-like isoform X1 [Esox lucius]
MCRCSSPCFPSEGSRPDPEMCVSPWCLLLLLLCPITPGMVLEDRAVSRCSRWLTYEMENREKIINNFKRHSEGTFTNDYTNYLDKIKAKDFVQWLVGTKRERGNPAW